MIPAAWFPILLTTHIILAVSLFVPSFALPFTMRTRGVDGDPVVGGKQGRVVHVLVWLEAHGTLIIGAGVAGMTAAETAAGAKGTKIVLVSKEPGLPYFRLNLTRYLAGEVTTADLRIKSKQWFEENAKAIQCSLIYC